MNVRKKLLVIGNGMAGMACLDEILRRKPDFDVTVLSEEPYHNYNRILLSAVLAGDKSVEEIIINTEEWYRKNGITLCLGSKAEELDLKNKVVTTGEGLCYEYDLLLLATGSNPFIPPIAGVKKRGVYTFRNIADTGSILEACKSAQRALVIGGGLLGLEAARGISNHGVPVTVVHLADRLMELQLDAVGGQFLKREIEKLGMEVLLNKSTVEVMGGNSVEGLLFKDGSIVVGDMVVIACGIRPNADLARKAGLAVRRGIVVNDHMETSAPGVYAVGECAEHREKVYGLVAPLYDQGKVLAAALTGNPGAPYEGSVLATKLKVAGIELFSAGDFKAEEAEKEVVSYQDHAFGIYKKIVVHQGRVVGSILIGDSSDAGRILEMIRKGERIGEKRERLLFDTPPDVPGSPSDVMSRPDSDTICGCIGVTKGQIVSAIRESGCKTVSDVKTCTKASTGCGTCTGLVQNILKCVAGSEFEEEKKEVL